MIAPEDRPLFYIAGPYTHPDPVESTHNAIKAGDEVWEAGACPVIPHLNMAWHLVSPAPYSTWLARDLGILARCDGVIRLPGDSVGADLEVTFADDHGIPVEHAGRSGPRAAAYALLRRLRQAAEAAATSASSAPPTCSGGFGPATKINGFVLWSATTAGEELDEELDRG